MGSSVGQIATPAVMAEAMGLTVDQYNRSTGSCVWYTMRYKDFTFPYNPAKSSMKCDRKYIMHKYLSVYGAEIEDFGPNAIIITGQGEFAGFGAYLKWDKLYAEFCKDGVGKVYHPIFTNVTRGIMTQLQADVEPRYNYVKYSFEIIADEDPKVFEDLTKDMESWASNEEAVSSGDSGDGGYVYQEGTHPDVYEGDIVYFTGNTHYTSSYPDGRGYNNASPCRAVINHINWDHIDESGYHPYHLTHCSGENSVLEGWVNTCDIQLITDTQSAPSDDIRNGGTIVHTVTEGETLSQICYRYATQYSCEVDWYVIAQRNNMTNPDVIYPGDKINITCTGASW